MNRILNGVLIFAIIILETLPFGVKMKFAPSQTERVYETFSYFSLTSFGYGNVLPLFTAILSVALFILSIVYLIKTNNSLIKVMYYISIIMFIFSLSPILYGVSSITWVGVLISFLTFLIIVCLRHQQKMLKY